MRQKEIPRDILTAEVLIWRLLFVVVVEHEKMLGEVNSTGEIQTLPDSSSSMLALTSLRQHEGQNEQPYEHFRKDIWVIIANRLADLAKTYQESKDLRPVDVIPLSPPLEVEWPPCEEPAHAMEISISENPEGLETTLKRHLRLEGDSDVEEFDDFEHPAKRKKLNDGMDRDGGFMETSSGGECV
jgi:hypothetical protein